MTAQQLQPPKPKLPVASSDTRRIRAAPGELGWRLLWLLNSYRLALAVLLAVIVAMSFSGDNSPTRIGLGAVNPTAFLVLCSAYIAAAALLAGLHRSRSPALAQQALTHLLTDTTLICLLTTMSGGVRSGLAVLLLFSLGTCAMVMRSTTTIAAAAFITLALFISEFFASFISAAPAALPQTGFLCAALFAAAWVTPRLARRVERLEGLVSQGSEDIARLQQINTEVVRQLDDGIIAVDGNDRVELCNAAALKLLGGTAPRHDCPLFDLSPTLAQQLQQWRRHQPLLTVKPRLYKLSFRQVGQRRRQGSVVLILQDLSEQHRQIHQTKLAAMGRLTASIAHEIRNPLNAIKQAGQLLQEAPELQGGDQNARLLDIVQRHSNRINGIIESVMQLSSSRPAEPSRLNLLAEINAAISDHSEASNLSPQQFSVTVDSAVQVEFDRGQLRQILVNLINNAARHAQLNPADVQITFSINNTDTENTRAETTGNSLQLLIGDNGRGLQVAGSDADGLADSEQFFEPFYSHDPRGSGLGLFICRQLAQANDGTLSYRPANEQHPHAFVLRMQRASPSTAASNSDAP